MSNSLDNLSGPEQHLLEDFLRKSSDVGERLAEDPIQIGDDVDVATVQESFEQVMSLVSNDTDSITLRVFALDRLEAEIQSKSGSIIEPPEETPPEADITREKLNKLLIRDEVINYFLLSGALIEQFTIELIIEEITSESRQSGNNRSRVEQMSEAEREDLLHMAGVLTDGEKGKIRRAYKIRNTLAHSPDPVSVTETIKNIESDIERTREAIDTLHEKIHGIPLDYRISNLLVDEE